MTAEDIMREERERTLAEIDGLEFDHPVCRRVPAACTIAA